MVICLERGADLHTAQLIPLPLTVSCFSKIQIVFTFLVPAHLGSPGQRAVKRVCVCVNIIMETIEFVPFVVNSCGLLRHKAMSRWRAKIKARYLSLCSMSFGMSHACIIIVCCIEQKIRCTRVCLRSLRLHLLSGTLHLITLVRFSTVVDE